MSQKLTADLGRILFSGIQMNFEKVLDYIKSLPQQEQTKYQGCLFQLQLRDMESEKRKLALQSKFETKIHSKKIAFEQFVEEKQRQLDDKLNIEENERLIKRTHWELLILKMIPKEIQQTIYQGTEEKWMQNIE